MKLAINSGAASALGCIAFVLLWAADVQAQSVSNALRGREAAGRVRPVAAAVPDRPDMPKNLDVWDGSVRILNTYVVTNTNDTGAGSFRKAILDANANAGLDMIVFSIGSGVQTITPLTPLPNIVSPVIIDGTTQGGYSGSPLIEINGSLAGVSVNGLTMWAGGSTVRGLVINRFIGTGPPNYYNGMAIYLDYYGGNKIEGCYIGTDPTGTIDLGNGGVGVGIFYGAGSNIIGGTTPEKRNVMSGNLLHGVQISPGTTGRNVVQGNYFGVNAAGTADLGNDQAGVAIFGSTYPDTIGGSTPGAGNLLSGNDIDGIYIAPNVASILIQGNYIGTDVTGLIRLGNTWEGIEINGTANTIIGGTTPVEGNLISGNGNGGIYIYGANARNTKVFGNFIGLSSTGSDTIGNTFGVVIDRAPNDTIGIAVPGGGNVISGNRYAGVYVYHPTATGNVIQGNYIGTDVNGSAALGNRRYGIVLDSAANTTIGGGPVYTPNLISGNDSAGIQIIGSTATGNRIASNLIGVKLDGFSPLPNRTGVLIDNAPKNKVGGTTLAERNVISGNTSVGIEIRNAGATGNRVIGNFIGTDYAGIDSVGNGSYGVLISSSQDTIGGTTASERNIIAYNKGAGVYDSSGTGNLIRMNSIHSNRQGLGIDLGLRGLARNDSLDPDAGANNLQNFPLLDSVVVSGGNTTIHGRFNSSANGSFYLDFFSNARYDSSHFGEGETYLGSATVRTNDSGNARINVVLPLAVPLTRYISATATDSATGSTSEFSQCICLSDSDDDGIMDSWETQGWGLDVNADSLVDLDLYAKGARVRHKDLFLEVDAMSGLGPKPGVLNMVINSFGGVPNSLLNNPDGAAGIKLHIDPLDADTAIPVANWPNVFTDFDNVKKDYFGRVTERASPNKRYILEAKHLVYRYCIFARSYGVSGDTGSSGRGELANGLGGNDFMVTLGSVGWNGGTVNEQAGTLMHEMGHTLGLWHGGNNNQNYKPNYYSIMNYAWQVPFNWQAPGSWRLNYSTDSLMTLDETSLSEPAGLNPPGPYVRYPVIAVPFTDSLRNIRWARMRSGTAVDWTGNGDSTRVGANVDINLVGERAAVTTPNQQLNGFVDWRHIQYNFRHSPNFTPGVHMSIREEEPEELTREIFEVLNSLPPPRPVGQFIMDGQLDTAGILLASNAGISLYGRFKAGQLYVATNSAPSQGADMFIFVADARNALRSAPWGKAGQVAAWTACLANESADNSSSWSAADESALNTAVSNAAGTVLEGVVDVELLFGSLPPELFLAVGKYGTDPGGALIAQVPVGNGDGNIDPSELFQFTDPALPVQLASFTATFVSRLGVRLEWVTLSEVNNYGFEVQRRMEGATTFETLPNSFVRGYGTTTEPHYYVFVDSTAGAGQWWYRLKQIDLDGTIHYGPAVTVTVPTGVGEESLPKVFALYQNYPNPFNPSTSFRYDVPSPAHVTLKVYNVLGQEVATLVNEMKSAGRYRVTWKAAGVASGVYYYRIQAGDFVATEKLLLLR